MKAKFISIKSEWVKNRKIGGLPVKNIPDDVYVDILSNGVFIFSGAITEEMREANAKAIAEHEVSVAVANGFGQEDQNAMRYIPLGFITPYHDMRMTFHAEDGKLIQSSWYNDFDHVTLIYPGCYQAARTLSRELDEIRLPDSTY